MGNRQATPPRSFNTVKHSNRKERLARQNRGRIILLAMCVVVLAILLTLTVFVFCSIAETLNNRTPAQDGAEETTPEDSNQPAVRYVQKTQTNQSIHTGELIVVNQELAYQFAHATPTLVTLSDVRTKVEGITPFQIAYPYPSQDRDAEKMEKTAAKALNEMLTRAYLVTMDRSVLVTSAHRTAQQQEESLSTTPVGHSEHHTGFCVTLQKEIDGSRYNLESDHWIYENCHKYGFIVRYPAGKELITGVSDYDYCFRYVGVAHATYIAQNNLALEEYVERLQKNYAADNHLQIHAADGNLYEVYYIPAANGELTTVNVPDNYPYTISGDNRNGFIVTVHLSTPNA